MRPRVPWMNETDTAILEFFEELDSPDTPSVALPPTAVWFNLSVEMGVLERSKSTVSRRMKKLGDIGLLSKVDDERGYYRLTDKGRTYLAGELEADELRLEE